MSGGSQVERTGGFWFFYDTVLVAIEKATSLILLTIVLFSGLMGTIGPKFCYTGNVEAKHRMVICSVYLCLLGAVIATRKCKHIAVDAITPHLSDRVRHKLEGILMLIGAVSVSIVAYKAGEVPEKTVSSSLRIPVMIAFFNIGFHFAVTGVARLMGIILGDVEGPLEESGSAEADHQAANEAASIESVQEPSAEEAEAPADEDEDHEEVPS